MNIDDVIFQAPTCKNMRELAEKVGVNDHVLRYRLAGARKLALVKSIFKWNKLNKNDKQEHLKVIKRPRKVPKLFTLHESDIWIIERYAELHGVSNSEAVGRILRLWSKSTKLKKNSFDNISSDMTIE